MTAERVGDVVERESRRRRRWPWLLLVVVLLAVGGVVVARQLLSKDDVFASPQTVELPALPKDKGPTVAYLQGPEGVRVTQFVNAAAPVLDAHATARTCRTAVAALDAFGTPDLIFAAAAGVPDAATADMAVNHLSAVSRFLGLCLEEGAPPSRDEVRFTAIVLQRRLDALR